MSMDETTYNLSTAYGSENITIHFTDGEHAFVTTARNSAITINRVQYRFSAHVFLQSDGSWKIGRESENSYERRQHLHGTRVDWTNYNESHISEAARQKLAPEIELAVTNFAVNNKRIVLDAQKQHLTDILDRAAAKVDEIAGIASKALHDAAEAEAALAKFVKENF